MARTMSDEITLAQIEPQDHAAGAEVRGQGAGFEQAKKPDSQPQFLQIVAKPSRAKVRPSPSRS